MIPFCSDSLPDLYSGPPIPACIRDYHIGKDLIKFRHVSHNMAILQEYKIIWTTRWERRRMLGRG
jgi:hypothetical protein